MDYLLTDLEFELFRILFLFCFILYLDSLTCHPTYAYLCAYATHFTFQVNGRTLEYDIYYGALGTYLTFGVADPPLAPESVFVSMLSSM